jgi:hypothetical protein
MRHFPIDRVFAEYDHGMVRPKRAEKFGGFTVAGQRQKDEKNRGMQVLVILVMVITGFAAVVAYGGGMVGYILLPISLVTLIWLFVLALRRWEY